MPENMPLAASAALETPSLMHVVMPALCTSLAAPSSAPVSTAKYPSLVLAGWGESSVSPCSSRCDGDRDSM
jgi:hypothetical protein